MLQKEPLSTAVTGGQTVQQYIHLLFRMLGMISFCLLCIALLNPVYAAKKEQKECEDYKAKIAADKLAKAFLGKKSEVFQQAIVLKRHHPSLQKEVASYIKADNQYYTMFSIVNSSCTAFFIKRAGPR
ncbi:hypothetical protein [Oceanospirillum multiglobuliferum]|nr:hypothetical protein [Oceanospirillum multiglobuliferum]